MDRHCTFLTPCASARSFFDSRPWHLMSALEETSRDVERQFNRLQQHFTNTFREHGNVSSGQSLGLQPEIVSEGDERKYRLSIHMGSNFTPENLKVSVKDGVVTVHGKKEQKSEDGNSVFYQEVTRKFTLPSNLDSKAVKSALTSDGVLKIEAPLPQQALPEPPKATDIPVLLE